MITRFHGAIKPATGSFKSKEQDNEKPFEISSLASHQF